MIENPFKNIPPPIPSRGEVSGLHRKADHEEEVEVVDFRDVSLEETPEQAERRRENINWAVEACRDFDQRIVTLLEERWLESGGFNTDYADLLHDQELLRSGEVINAEYINGGSNGTRLLLLKSDQEKKIAAFEKSLGGELGQVVDPATGDLLTTINQLVDDDFGNTVRKTHYKTSRPVGGDKTNKMIKEHFKEVYESQEDHKKREAEYYGYSATEYPIDHTVIGLRSLEIGKSIRREYVCSALDKILGLNTVPLTILSTDGEELYSRQKGIMNTLPLDSAKTNTNQLIQSLVEHGQSSTHKSLMRLAVLHDLVEQTDGHLGNILLDNPSKQHTEQVHGIDFGFSFPTHYQLSTNHVVPSDVLRSAAIELVELDEVLRLDSEAMASIAKVYKEVKDYTLYQDFLRGPQVFSPQERQRLEALSQDVKDGRVARLMYELISFAYEVEGKPDITAAITKKEFWLFMDRIKGVIDTGRPRRINKDYHPGFFARTPGLDKKVIGVQSTRPQFLDEDDGIRFLDA